MDGDYNMRTCNVFFTKYSNILKLLIILSITLYVLTFAVEFTLQSTALYNYDIEHLKLEETSNLNKASIKNNYNAVINYIKDKNVVDLKLPDLAMSKEGAIHFYEVKNIFILLHQINIISAFCSLLLIYIFFHFKNFSFLKPCSISLAALPAVLLFPFLVNFDKSFVFFHKIFFNNSYWEFDPIADPIINILPEEFFFHSILLIVLIIFIFSLVFAIFSLFIKKRRN